MGLIFLHMYISSTYIILSGNSHKEEPHSFFSCLHANLGKAWQHAFFFLTLWFVNWCSRLANHSSSIAKVAQEELLRTVLVNEPYLWLLLVLSQFKA